MMYLLAGMALVTALTGAWGAWERHSKETAEAKVETLETRLDAQNKAVAALKAEGDRRVAQATKGIAASAKVTQAAVSEAARLRKAGEGSTPPGPCPAGIATDKIRAGLK